MTRRRCFLFCPVQRKRIGDIPVPEVACEHKRRHAVIVRFVEIGAFREKQFHELLIIGFHGNIQRRHAIAGLGINIGVMIEEQSRHFGVAALCGYVQRSGAFMISEIDAGVMGEQELSDGALARHGRKIQRREALQSARPRIRIVRKQEGHQLRVISCGRNM